MHLLKYTRYDKSNVSIGRFDCRSCKGAIKFAGAGAFAGFYRLYNLQLKSS